MAALLALGACSNEQTSNSEQTYSKTSASAQPQASAEMGKMASGAMYDMAMSPPYPAPHVAQFTEKYPDAPQNSVKLVSKEPVSTFSIDVDTASYANTRRFLHDGQLPPRDAVRVEELVNYFDYGYAKPANAKVPFRATTTLVASPWSKDRQILHIGLQGYDVPQVSQPPLNLVLLIVWRRKTSPKVPSIASFC